ncbi:MAG TPA: sulfatase [Tepidisphaeraceae bacterium]|nr:sulfatase [Tepidisphaeraceae bacterium]
MKTLSRLTVALVCVILLSLAFGPSMAAGQARRPNVLFIAVDDLRPELGCYGQSQMKTPHMDGLAKRGLLFNRAYCQQAICSPSRISLLTGRRPDTTGIYDLNTHNRKTMPDVVTLPQHFKNNGYHSQGFGKIYHRGLDDELSWSVPHTDNRAMQYCDPAIIAAIKEKDAQGWEQGGRTKGPAWEIADCEDNELPDGWITDRAIAAMREVKDKPFFLAVGLEKPHLPFVAPKKYFDLYPPERIKLPPNMEAPNGAPQLALTNYAELRAYPGTPKGNEPFSEEFSRALIRGYYAATSYADAQVGRLLAELEELGLQDNTIVILWGDHGYHLGEQGLWCKHTNFENSTRTALMLYAPDQRFPGATTDALVELVDVYPSLCELAGLPLPEGLEGRSFKPLLGSTARPWKRAAFSQYPRQANNRVMGYSIRTESHRYTEWQTGWETPETATVIARELYDHTTDPRETTNLAARPDQAEIVKALADQLKDGWQAAQK